MEKYNLTYRKPKTDEAQELAEIRARTMRESLEKAGRYDEIRVRQRLLSTYKIEETVVFEWQDKRVGFFVISLQEEFYYLHHLYIDIPFQNMGLGTIIMGHIKKNWSAKDIKLNCLKTSRANDFYLKAGFIKESEDDLDNYYLYTIPPPKDHS